MSKKRVLKIVALLISIVVLFTSTILVYYTLFDKRIIVVNDHPAVHIEIRDYKKLEQFLIINQLLSQNRLPFSKRVTIRITNVPQPLNSTIWVYEKTTELGLASNFIKNGNHAEINLFIRNDPNIIHQNKLVSELIIRQLLKTVCSSSIQKSQRNNKGDESYCNSDFFTNNNIATTDLINSFGVLESN